MQKPLQTLVVLNLVLGAVVLIAAGAQLILPSEAPITSPTPQPTQSVAVVETPSPTPSVTATPEPVAISLMFGGDVMLGRTVQRRMESFGAGWPFAKVAATMAAADLTIVNLESPLRSNYPATSIDSLVLRGDPLGMEGIVAAGVDAMSLSNNHITDMGKVGLAETIAQLQSAGIGFTGAGSSVSAAEEPLILQKSGLRIGFISATYGVNFDSAGVYYNVATPEWVITQVTALKQKTDVVVVLCHCGTEYAPTPNAMQKAVAHAAIDAGAALFIGHHPHVPQPVERYGEGLIIYSLGNLVFDQMPGANRDQSALAKITLKNNKVESLELLPYKIYNYGQPQLLTDLSAKQAVWELFKLPGGKF